MTIIAIAGSGLVSGLLFAFANFVMQALAQLPAATGMEAMQRINVSIINPLFVVLFLGTALLCAAIVALSLAAPAHGGRTWLLLGGLAYLAGPFGITMAFNVPLNNRLAKAAAGEASSIWPAYVARWQAWNRLRTAIGVAATVLLAAGLFRLGASGA